MTDGFKNFWAWIGAGTAGAFGILAMGLILKDQQGAVNLINASTTGGSNLIKSLASVG